MQEVAQTLFQEQLGEEKVFESSCLEMIKEEQNMDLELHEDIGTSPIVLQEEIIENMCYHDQRTLQKEAPFFISTDSPLAESEIDLLLNINSQVLSSKFDDDLQQPCQISHDQDYNDCQLMIFQTYHFLNLYFREIISRRLISLLKSKMLLHFP